MCKWWTDGNVDFQCSLLCSHRDWTVRKRNKENNERISNKKSSIEEHQRNGKRVCKGTIKLSLVEEEKGTNAHWEEKLYKWLNKKERGWTEKIG